MRRREFLERGAIGTLAAGAAVGCGSALPRGAGSTALTRDQGRALVDRMEGTLADLEHLRFVSGQLEGERVAPVRAYVDRADPMAKRAIQALVVAAAAKEIPAGTEPPDEVAEAIARRVPLLDEHLLETTALFHRMPLQDRRRVGRHLAQDPDLSLRVVERIDRLGESAGVASGPRLNLRQAAREITFRMTKQPPSAFLDEQVMKVQRVAAQRGIEPHLMRQIATHASTAAILRSISALPAQVEGAVPEPPPHVEELPEPVADPEYRRGVVPLIVGGVLLGTGAVMLGITIPLFTGTSEIAWAVGITAGAAVALGGIICLIVGGALMGS